MHIHIIYKKLLQFLYTLTKMCPKQDFYFIIVEGSTFYIRGDAVFSQRSSVDPSPLCIPLTPAFIGLEDLGSCSYSNSQIRM